MNAFLPLDIEHESAPKVLEDVDEAEEGEVGDGEIDEEQIQEAESEFSEDAIKLYLRDIQKHKLLTADEEKELATKIDLGDKAARDKMIVSNLRLVVKMAKRYLNRGLLFLDQSISIGILCLNSPMTQCGPNRCRGDGLPACQLPFTLALWCLFAVHCSVSPVPGLFL